jgi:hypothetical protein
MMFLFTFGREVRTTLFLPSYSNSWPVIYHGSSIMNLKAVVISSITIGKEERAMVISSISPGKEERKRGEEKKRGKEEKKRGEEKSRGKEAKKLRAAERQEAKEGEGEGEDKGEDRGEDREDNRDDNREKE